MKEGGKTKVISSPLFPFEGNVMFIETEGEKAVIENFVANDPYVKAKLVKSFEIKEFDITTKKQFERMSGDFLVGS